ncbi:MAG TPA: hypothetical protein VEK80_13330, partial [Kribbellaceae bacterium]|nr:hypothetical protein [Kribbellaceae bacterium]
AERDRDQVHRELTQAPADYHALLEAATPDLLRRKTNGTRWTNREMLFHLLRGYLIVRNLLPLVRLITRLPPGAGRGFAGAGEALVAAAVGAEPDVVAVVGEVGSARVDGHARRRGRRASAGPHPLLAAKGDRIDDGQR